MSHLPDLIRDLGVILMTAAVVTLVFKRLRQPVVLGYLIAGVIVGPHFHWLPTVKETASITIWAEIGVIFMLFGLGLEFSFKKLMLVGKSASITAAFKIAAMLLAGYLAGRLLGWSGMDSLFLGGILSISSTMIIVRAFDELGIKSRGFVSLAFGVLIVEDLIAILLLVLLSSVAATQSLSGTELIQSSLRLVFFLVLWFLLGIYLLPVWLKRFKPHLSNETTLIVSIALCLMMVMVATHVGFSPALGAFVMGSLLAETREGHRIEHLLVPVKDLFSAVFFVSVGMLIDPTVLRDYWQVILLMTVLTILGKILSTTLGAVISGRSFRHSLQTGMSLAQIGEFSFIIATLGTSLGVTSSFLYPIAVAVSAVTTFTTPYLIRGADPLYDWIERRLPESIRESLTRYESTLATGSSSGVLALVWKEYGIKIVLNSVVVIALTLAISRFALPHFGETTLGGSITEVAPEHAPLNLLSCAVTLLASAPFLWAVFLGGPAHASAYPAEIIERLRRLQFGVSISRFMVGVALTGFVVSCFTSVLAVSGILLVALTAVGVLAFSRFSEPVYRKIEHRFVSNLTEKEREALESRPTRPELAPWNAALAEFTLTPDSELIAKTLQQSGLKERFGVTIAMIERGGRRILAPKRDDLLLPGDVVALIGTDDQLASAGAVIEAPATQPLAPLNSTGESFGLTALVLLATDSFVGKPIRECGLREAVSGLIVGIEREGERILSPDSAMVLKPGDLVWIVGDRGKIKGLRA